MGVLEKTRPKLETFKIGPWRAEEETSTELAESKEASTLQTSLKTH